ncbi:hypothetical protein RhoFasGS6_03893 [Rhodococcus fascians]|uniref:hypothetical protein n=1 Tax=Rhodococcoides fascians TaxID=1828 RepID=UPI001427CE32|nr:hypothetical protein [Rhodococcus fascians]
MDRIESRIAQFARKLGAWGEAWRRADRANRLTLAFGLVLMGAGVLGTIITWIV